MDSPLFALHPCYNGYGVHRWQDQQVCVPVVILVIMDMVYEKVCFAALFVPCVTHPLNSPDIRLLPCGSAKSASSLCSRSAASVPVRGTYYRPEKVLANLVIMDMVYTFVYEKSSGEQL